MAENQPKINSIISGSPFVGEMLVGRGIVSAEDRDRALHIQGQIGGRLGSILIRIGAISEDLLLPVLAEQLAMPLIEAEELPADVAAHADWLDQSGISREWWVDQEAFAWESSEGVLCCVARDPLEPSLVEMAQRSFPGRTLEWRLLRTHDLDRYLEKLARSTQGQFNPADEVSHLREMAEEAPVIEFANNLLAQAVDQNASDVHLEPQEREFYARFRVDGVLHTKFVLPRERFDAISSRIKLISAMDIAERRLPQDGRMRHRASGKEFDIRVSAVPGVHGESIVMRLLPTERDKLAFDSLGFIADQQAQLNDWISQPHGIILVTGPTGSGKSTTLYAALERINDGRKKIITVEDPVEFQLPGITQIQTQAEIGYTFASALRAVLRQDPDVVMIGEIRDLETAEIAVQASLTGHLVLSTLHTNDAAGAFIRLIDMGIEPFLVATPVRGVLAQRLVRRLCPSCSCPVQPSADIVELTEAALPECLAGQRPDWRAAKAEGCKACRGTGYHGRFGIYEMIEVDVEMQRLIVANASPEELAAKARQEGGRSLRQDGLIKAWQGWTSIEEVLRVTAS